MNLSSVYVGMTNKDNYSYAGFVSKERSEVASKCLVRELYV